MDISELKATLGDDLYAQVTEKVSGVENLRLINTADGKWIPKSRFDAERQTSKDLQSQIDDLNKQIADSAKAAETAGASYKAQIEKLEKSVEESKTKITELTGGISERDAKIGSLTEDLTSRDGTINGLNQNIAERDATISGMRREAQIRRELSKFSPRDPDIVYKLIDQSKIGEEGGNLTGLTEQIDSLKKEQAYLFGKPYSHKGGFDDKPTETPKHTGNADINNAIRSAFGR